MAAPYSSAYKGLQTAVQCVGYWAVMTDSVDIPSRACKWIPGSSQSRSLSSHFPEQQTRETSSCDDICASEITMTAAESGSGALDSQRCVWVETHLGLNRVGKRLGQGLEDQHADFEGQRHNEYVD
eukprot:1192300-Prorocentrum_minimum.AAC.1